MKRIFFLLVFTGISLAIRSQDAEHDIPFRMTVRAAATVPHGLSNKAFRRSFTGIYNITAGYYYQVFKGFQAGLQFEHSLWKTADNKIPGINTYGQTFHGGFRIGYDRVVGTNAVTYFGVSILQGTMKFYGLTFANSTDLSNLQTKYTYSMMCADAGIFFYTEGSFAIGIHVGADYTSYAFDPYKLYLNQHKAYIASDLNGNVSQLNTGFSVVYSFFSDKPKTQ